MGRRTVAERRHVVNDNNNVPLSLGTLDDAITDRQRVLFLTRKIVSKRFTD